MSKEFAIKLCLQRIKILCEGNRYAFINRKNNLQTLFNMELCIDDVISALLNLKVEDYLSGPEDDYDGSDGQIWKFQHPVSGCNIYIKIKFWEFKGEDRLKILSFHS